MGVFFHGRLEFEIYGISVIDNDWIGMGNSNIDFGCWVGLFRHSG